MKNERKIAIYARKSKLTETGKSIDNQITKCKNSAYDKFKVTDDDIIIYHDDGKSGFYSDRPEYMRMLKDIEQGRIKAVICYKFDRISRKTIDLLNLVERLKAKKIALVSCSDEIDTSNPMGKILMSMLAVIAEFERDIIAERISDNLYELAKEGRWLGGTTPTGFYSKKEVIQLHGRKSTVNHLEIIPKELIIVKKLFGVFLEKRSIQGVVRYTRQSNILTKTGKKHTRVSIKNILANPVYAIADEDIYNYYTQNNIKLYAEKDDFNGINGLMVYNKTEQLKELKDDSYALNPKYVHKKTLKKCEEWVISVGKHKGIIQGRDWIMVQEILTENKSSYSRPNTKTESLLSGLIACPVCGKNLYTHKESNRFEENGEPRFLYKCSSRKEESTACTYKPIRGNLLDKFILDTLCKIGNTNSDEYYKALENEIKRSSFDVLKEETENLKTSIKRLKTDIEVQTQNLRFATDTTRSFILSDIEKMLQDLKTAENQLKVLEENKSSNVTTIDGLNKARELINSFESLIDVMTYEEKLELVRLVIAKIYVVNKDYITDTDGNPIANDEVHIFLKGSPDEDYTKFFKKNNPIKQNIENAEAQSLNGVEFLFCRNSDNMLIPLIHITVPTKELSENPTVGEKIRFYRFKQNLTQEKLANMLKINKSTMLRYETDDFTLSLEMVNNIAQILNIPANFLYDDYYLFLAYPASKKIKEYREKNNLTQKALADKLDVHFKTIQYWENNKHIIDRQYYEIIKKIGLK